MPTPFRVGMQIVTTHGHAEQRGHATQVCGQAGGMPIPAGWAWRADTQAGGMPIPAGWAWRADACSRNATA